MTVCIISNATDVHAIFVEEALIKKNVPVVTWHWTDFPRKDQFSVELSSPHGLRNSPVLQGPMRENTLWVHRGITPVPSSSLHPADIEFARHESVAMLSGLLFEFADAAFCVNPLEAVRKRKSKINQLTLAVKCGLKIPPTIFSNDPVAVRRFYHEHDGKIIVKHSSQLRWKERETGTLHQTYTSSVTEQMLLNDAQLSACPSIFQGEIAKSFELRIVFIGTNMFAVRINSQSSGKSIDWRKDFASLPPVEPFALLEHDAARLKHFIRSSGLLYGSIDAIIDPAGELTFLEVNETGQFLWIEELIPELPLLDCFVEFLARRDPDYHYVAGKKVARQAEFDHAITTEALEKRAQGRLATLEATTIFE